MKGINRNALAAGLVATLSVVLATPVVTRDGEVYSAGLPAKTGVGGDIAGAIGVGVFGPNAN